jgi:ABC-type nitrate/sulfonate/bicarbonate transport system permease component
VPVDESTEAARGGVVAAKILGSRRTRHILALRFAVAAAVVAVWQGAVELGWVRPLFLAPPSAVVETLWELVREGTLWVHVGTTMQATPG